MKTTVADLRDLLVKAHLPGKVVTPDDGAAVYSRRTNEEAANVALVVFGDWLLDRIAEEMAKPKHNGRCPCGRATLVSERSGRMTAYGMIYDEIVLLTEGTTR